MHEIYEGEATGVGHVPAWMVIDQRYRNRYLFAGLLAAAALPGPLVQERHRQEGAPRSTGSPPRSAYRPTRCAATVDRFNGFAATGVDEDFHRGESAYDKYYSDPTVKPNPSLHAIDQAPFYAVKIVPGDLGTKGGLVTDERARVLRPDGSVIPGLYAAGNVSSAVMGHTYAGPGATIGPALTFGYLAAEDIATVEVRGVRADASKPRPEGDLHAHRPVRRHRRRARRGRLLVDRERRAALPPRHRRRLPPGRQPLPHALRYTLDGPRLQVLPSFGVVAPTFHVTDPPPLDLPGCDINLAQVVHGSQSIAVTGPLPTSGSATVHDPDHRRLGQGQGRGDLAGGRRHLAVRRGAVDHPVVDLRRAARAAGAATAARPTPVELPDRAPDADTTYDVTPQQALLYRLCGDRNPLHADPDFAKAAGFPAPILHGLCSYGIVLRELTDALLGGDATRVGGFGREFAGVVFPARRSGCAAGWRTAGSWRRRPSPATAIVTARRCSATSCLTLA